MCPPVKLFWFEFEPLPRGFGIGLVGDFEAREDFESTELGARFGWEGPPKLLG